MANSYLVSVTVNSEKLKVVSIATKGIHGHCSYSIQHSKDSVRKIKQENNKKAYK